MRIIKIMEPLVNTLNGRLNGLRLTSRNGKGYFGFLGIPYAKPPKRFQAAERMDNWNGTRNAKEFGSRCIQKDILNISGTEDCLYLNVYTPQIPEQSSSKLKMPVMFFIHGGGFMFGAGSDYGAKYLMDNDILFVTINYRLGVFGFLNTGDNKIERNLGLKDQVLALQWCQQNIELFGGDKDNVTIFGESAGAACVHYHVLSPVSKGLFSRAIIQSGSANCPWGFMNNPEWNLRMLARNLKFQLTETNRDEFIEFLKNADAKAIAAQNLEMEWNERIPMPFAPSVETLDCKSPFLTDTPINIMKSGKFNKVPIIMGVNTEEGLMKASSNLLTLAEKFDKHWNKIAPLDLVYKQFFPESQLDEVSQKIRKYYFGDKEISMKCLDEMSKMYSDAWHFYPCKKMALAHVDDTQDSTPMYLYLFSYRGECSILNSFGFEGVSGVAHFDEMQYLTNSTFFSIPVNKGSKSEEFSKKFINYWVNFARNGDPNSNVELSSSISRWNPLPKGKTNNLEWYSIDTVSKYVEEPFEERMKFWDNLGIQHDLKVNSKL